MIEPAEFLLSLAEIAVALAGFSGLIVAIRATATDGWHPRDIWSLSWMMGASVGVLFLALLPLWLGGFDLPAAAAYHVSAIVACVYCTALLVLMTAIGRALTRRGYPRRIPFFPTAMVTLLVTALAAVGAVAAGAVPTGWTHGTYTGGLIALLLVASLALAVFLVLLARSVGARREDRRVTMTDGVTADGAAADAPADRGA
ncbi:hypothetical protein [Lentisalinibacter salinarum]|uniref:hypothetical protein n=1 Tax=Lentisalinibacter salinarum TaxID=2992239 RepID=UPI003870C7A6